jgi:hypothetical protein
MSLISVLYTELHSRNRFFVNLAVIGFAATLLLCVHAVHAGDEPLATFGDEVLFLELPFEHALAAPHLSPYGNFAAATVSETTPILTLGGDVASVEFQDRHFFFWDLRGTQGNVIMGQEITLDNYSFGNRFAFSPDEALLAFQDNDRIAIRSVPDMEVVAEVSFSTPDIDQSPEDEYLWMPSPSRMSLNWSTDGQILVGANQTELIAWDRITGEVKRYVLPYVSIDEPYPYFLVSVIPLPAGWFIWPHAVDQTYDLEHFYICERGLEACERYDFEDLVDARISSDGSIVLTRPVLNDSHSGYFFGVWRQQTDGSYILDNELTELPAARMGEFSYDSQYLLMPLSRLSQYLISIPDLETAAHWEFPEIVDFHWFPNANFLVGLQQVPYLPRVLSLVLQSVDHSDPIAQMLLNDIAQEEITYLDNYYADSLSANSYVADITQDGRALLVSLGKTALVVPIEYGEQSS